jgi:hypothetical protein
MSLPVYKAISFHAILDKGGHSKPWVVMVDLEGVPKPYVVKLYKTQDIEARNKMTAEVFGNIMAKEFGLEVPEAAIINFTSLFCMQLNNECDQILTEIDGRPKFGSAFIEGCSLYNPQLERAYVKDIINPATLYAYDYFICNRDRGVYKTNLLVKNNIGFLIDHEMALEISPQTKKNFLNGIWDDRYKSHLFYEYLRKSQNKDGIFDEFLFYLQELRLSLVNSYFSQLKDLGFETNKKLIVDYWQSIHTNPNVIYSIN